VRFTAYDNAENAGTDTADFRTDAIFAKAVKGLRLVKVVRIAYTVFMPRSIVQARHNLPMAVTVMSDDSQRLTAVGNYKNHQQKPKTLE